MEKICEQLSKLTDINVIYINLTIKTLIVILLTLILKYITKNIINIIIKNNSKNYKINQYFKTFFSIFQIIIILFIWDNYIKNIMTFISVISGAALIALRDILFNFFSGIYIKIKKIIKVEDRIEINGLKGDVINISSLSFDVLELDETECNGQSTGIVITFPNSKVFTQPIKNYSKIFKYIWDEITIKLNLDCDLTNNKKNIYEIVNSIDDINTAKKKMKSQLKHSNDSYRIYYNSFDPIIYTKIVDNYIELKLRFLVNPKKARNIESIIWNKIIELYKKDVINLYKN